LRAAWRHSRPAHEESILPGRVPEQILSKFTYDAETCRTLAAKDRSSIYGGFHLYVHKPAEARA